MTVEHTENHTTSKRLPLLFSSATQKLNYEAYKNRRALHLQNRATNRTRTILTSSSEGFRDLARDFLRPELGELSFQQAIADVSKGKTDLRILVLNQGTPFHDLNLIPLFGQYSSTVDIAGTPPLIDTDISNRLTSFYQGNCNYSVIDLKEIPKKEPYDVIIMTVEKDGVVKKNEAVVEEPPKQSEWDSQIEINMLARSLKPGGSFIFSGDEDVRDLHSQLLISSESLYETNGFDFVPYEDSVFVDMKSRETLEPTESGIAHRVFVATKNNTTMIRYEEPRKLFISRGKRRLIQAAAGTSIILAAGAMAGALMKSSSTVSSSVPTCPSGTSEISPISGQVGSETFQIPNGPLLTVIIRPGYENLSISTPGYSSVTTYPHQVSEQLPHSDTVFTGVPVSPDSVIGCIGVVQPK